MSEQTADASGIWRETASSAPVPAAPAPEGMPGVFIPSEIAEQIAVVLEMRGYPELAARLASARAPEGMREAIARHLFDKKMMAATHPVSWERLSEFGRENAFKEADAILAIIAKGEGR